MPKVTSVEVTVRVDQHFIRQLWANVQLGELHKKDKLTAKDQLALAVCYEARGAIESQVDAAILHEWRDNLEVLHEKRVANEVA